MTNEQAKLIEVLLERQKEMLGVLDGLVEAQIILTHALCPQVVISLAGDDEPPTLQ